MARITVNNADQQQLMLVPGIGERLSESIIVEREDNGPFRDAEDLANRVSGITQEKANDEFDFGGSSGPEPFDGYGGRGSVEANSDSDSALAEEQPEAEEPGGRSPWFNRLVFGGTVVAFVLAAVALGLLWGTLNGMNRQSLNLQQQRQETLQMQQDHLEVQRQEVRKLKAEATQMANEAAQPTPVPTSVPENDSNEMASLNEETATEEQSSGQSSEAAVEGITSEMPEDLYRTPVEAEEVFNQASAWLIAEPGVILDATATFDRGNSSGEHFSQCPEGGFFYASLGEGTVSADDMSMQMVSGEGINNLVVVRCRIDDGQQDTDLNLTVRTSNYTPGHVMTSPMPAGAYVSMDWVADQLTMSAGNEGQSGGNCGASGCSDTYVHLLDVTTGFYQQFLVEKPDISSWELVN